MDSSEVIERLKQVFDVNKDSELAEALGKHRNFVYALRQRDSVPYDECARVAHETGASLDWLILGRGRKSLSEPAVEDSSDPRVGRLIEFFGASTQSFQPDEIAWMEQQIRRAIPEYDDYLHKAQQEGAGDE